MKRRPGSKSVRIHQGKLSGTVLSRRLQAIGLVEDEVSAEHPGWSEWYLVEEKTARLYMSMLAQFISDTHDDHMVPGTDRPENEALVYGTKSIDGFPCVETRFQRILPIPGPKVSIQRIVAFKKKRESELLQYRACVDALQATLAVAQSRSDVKNTLIQFEERQRKEVLNLTQAMADEKMTTMWGSLKSLVKTSVPALWTAIATAHFGLPVLLPATLGGLALGGTIEAGSYLVDRRNEKRAALREASFSYVHHAKKEGLR